MPEDPRAVWEVIAPEFSRTRPEPWREVVAWVEANVPGGGRVVDVGAGNARHSLALRSKGYRSIAVDFARPFLVEAHGAGAEAVLADARALPLRSGSFDGGVFIASLHNIPGREARVRALEEVARTLRRGAPLLVTVWLREGQAGDREVAWRGGPRRFYHFYTPESLRVDAEAAGLRVLDVTPVAVGASGDPDNLFLAAAKQQGF